MFLVGVAGGSGSGKTTFTQKVKSFVNSENLDVLHQDSYYLATPSLGNRVHGEPNFDHPEAFDWALLKEHLTLLRAGKKIEIPVYDYTISRRTTKTISLGPCSVVLFEGIFALWDEEIRNLLDLKVFLHVDADIRFIRRLHRDVKDRGRTLDSIIRQYYDTVRGMHNTFLEPTKQFADLIVGDETDIAAEMIAARMREILKKGDTR